MITVIKSQACTGVSAQAFPWAYGSLGQSLATASQWGHRGCLNVLGGRQSEMLLRIIVCVVESGSQE